MIKYLLSAVIFVLLVFFSLNYWEKAKKDSKKFFKTSFFVFIIIVISFLTFLVYD